MFSLMTINFYVFLHDAYKMKMKYFLWVTNRNISIYGNTKLMCFNQTKLRGIQILLKKILGTE